MAATDADLDADLASDVAGDIANHGPGASLAVVSLDQPPTTALRRPTEQDWAEKMPLIKALYATHTVEQLRAACGFAATPRQFRRRFARWGLPDKKNKEHEMAALLRKFREREHEHGADAPTQGRIRGRVVALAEIHRYARRKGLSLDELLSREHRKRHAVREGTPPAVVCRTPSPVHIDPPASLMDAERVFFLIRQYTTGSFLHGSWVPPSSPSGSVVEMIESDEVLSEPVRTPIQDFSNLATQATFYFWRGDHDEGLRRMDRACAKVKPALADEEMDTLFRVYQVLHELDSLGLDAFEVAILRYITQMVQIMLPLGHPLRQFWVLMSSLSHEEFLTMMNRAMKLHGDCIESLQGPLHLNTVSLRLGFRVLGIWTADDHQAYLQKITALATAPDVDPEVLALTQIHLGILYHDSQEYSKALELMDQLLALVPADADLSLWRAWELKAACHWNLQHADQAISSLLQAIIQVQGEEGAKCARFWMLEMLEDWYLQMNRSGAAMEVARNLEAIRKSFDESTIE